LKRNFNGIGALGLRFAIGRFIFVSDSYARLRLRSYPEAVARLDERAARSAGTSFFFAGGAARGGEARLAQIAASVSQKTESSLSILARCRQNAAIAFARALWFILIS
jgi:hypothetical protein